MTAGHSRARVMYDTLKRCFDVVGASIFLVLLSPVFAAAALAVRLSGPGPILDRKSTRLNSSHRCISYAVFCLKKKKKNDEHHVTHRIMKIRGAMAYQRTDDR